MVKRTLRYLWGKKFILLVLVLVVLLLPDIIDRNLQVRTTTVITQMTIDARQPTMQITAEKLKSSPGSKTMEHDTQTFTGTDVQAMLADVSLAHCTNLEFVGDPDINILLALYNYQDLRANTKVNGDQTIDAILKNQYYCCPQSSV